jgi:WD40 repeat protein
MQYFNRSQYRFIIITTGLIYLIAILNWNVLKVSGNPQKSTPTAQFAPTITADNVSRLQRERVIGKSVQMPGPYLPIGGVDVLFSPKGTYIASDYNTGGSLRIWNVKTGQRVAYLPGQRVFVREAVFTPDERFVATSDYDGTIRIWSLVTLRGKIVNIKAGDEFTRISIVASPDGQTFAVATDGNQVTLVDAQTGNIKRTLKGKGGTGFFGADFVQFSPDGNSLVVTASVFLPDKPGINAILTLWDVNTFQYF